MQSNVISICCSIFAFTQRNIKVKSWQNCQDFINSFDQITMIVGVSIKVCMAI